MTDKLEELEEKYEVIMGLYDLADELAATVDSRIVEDPQSQFDLVEPLIEQVGISTDELTEEFINLAEGKPAHKSKVRVEKALRRIYAALDSYYLKLNKGTRVVSTAITNIADPIVKKIKEDVERVIVIFLDFVTLSLERVMHKQELEELKLRQTNVAIQLHQMAQQQP